MHSAKGFTLIEIMIVVAIIAILTTIALPAYQNYVARTEFAAALQEITAGKSSFESELLAESISSVDPRSIGLQAETTRCSTSIDSSATGYIRCQMKGSSLVSGKTVTLQRSGSGTWNCVVNPTVSASFRPSTCS